MCTVAGHARLAGNASRNQDDLTASQGLCQAVATGFVALNSAVCVDVSNVGGDTGGTLDIVKSKLSHTWVQLHEERERLANATSSTKDGNLGVL